MKNIDQTLTQSILKKELTDFKEGLQREISLLVDEKINQRIDKLENKLFDWKSEVISAVDSVAREMNTNQEFREIIGNQIEEQGAKIMKLEKKVFGSVSV